MRLLWHKVSVWVGCVPFVVGSVWRPVEVLENVGVVVRPRSKGGVANGRARMLRRLRSEGVARARLYSYGAKELGEAASALGPGCKIAVSVPDAEVEAVGHDLPAASRVCDAIGTWARAGVVDLVVVGVTPPSGVGADAWRLASLANATRNVRQACAAANATVRVSTAFSLNVLRSSFPPSASLFAAPGPLHEILVELRSSGSPFVIEIDPYLAWRQSYYDISLEYALFGIDRDAGAAPQFVDEGSGAGYWNLFDAMLDGLRWALSREGFGDLDVVVGKIGWPTGPIDAEAAAALAGGDAVVDDSGATVANAAAFNSRLAKHMRTATPVGAGGRAPVVTYVYEADDSPTSDDGLRWGVCAAGGGLKYSLRTGRVFRDSTWGQTPLGADAATRGPALAALQLVLAAVSTAVVVAVAVTVVAWLAVYPRRTFKRHSPTRVAAIVRAATFKAEENLRDERSRRAKAAPKADGADHRLIRGPLLLGERPQRPLSTVAESPMTSDIDEADWGLRGTPTWASPAPSAASATRTPTPTPGAAGDVSSPDELDQPGKARIPRPP